MGIGIIPYEPTMIIRQSIRKSGILQSEGNPLRKETENDLGGTSLVSCCGDPGAGADPILTVKQNITLYNIYLF